MAPGPLAPVRRGCLLLGARRDRQGAGGHPRHRRRGGGLRQAQPGGRGRHCRGARGRVGRAQPPPARRARGRVRARRRPPRRGVLRLAALLRGDGRDATAGARLRGPPLRRRRAARLRRLPRRLGDGRPAARDRHGASGATRTAAGLGRRQGERAHALPLVALGHGDGADRARAARPGRAACRPPAAAARARGGQPAVRGGVRAPRRRRQAAGGAARDRAGDRRRAARRARTRREAGAPGRVRAGESVLARRGRPSLEHEPWALEERLHGLERKEFVRRERRPRSLGRRSTPSGICSSATSRMARSRAPTERRSTAWRRSGSRPSAGPRTTPRWSPTTTSRPSS